MIRIMPIVICSCLLFSMAITGFSDNQDCIEQKIEVLTKKGYQLSSNVRLEDIKATGLRLTQESWDGFVQICERLVLQLGNLRVYFDIEARVMFVYSEQTAVVSQEAYYVQF